MKRKVVLNLTFREATWLESIVGERLTLIANDSPAKEDLKNVHNKLISGTGKALVKDKEGKLK